MGQNLDVQAGTRSRSRPGLPSTCRNPIGWPSVARCLFVRRPPRSIYLGMHPSLLTGGTGRPKPKKPRLSPVRRAAPPRFYFHSRAQVGRPAGSQGLCGSSLYLLSYSLPCSSTGLGGLHRAAVTEPYHRPPRLRAQLLYQSSCLHPFEQQVAEPTYPVETCVSALPHHQNTCSFGRRTATGGLRPGYSQPSSCGR